MLDVIVAGAGPAGSAAAIGLARAGARVLLLDRATFPRDKLCGDTVNPGALAVLRRAGVVLDGRALPIRGMVVTGPGGVSVEARYPEGIAGRAIVRRDLDQLLLQRAAAGGVDVEEGVLVRGAAVDVRGVVTGVHLRRPSGGTTRLEARLVIAADGRESRVARSVSLLRHPRRPRRWAVGAYFENVGGLRDLGEMHVRAGHYIGVAPVPGGLANACVVTADRARLRQPEALITAVVRDEPLLAPRFAAARLIGRPVVLGPLAVDCAAAGSPGLLLAGDAAGFIDPMTGDGLWFALRGAELTALEALRALETGDRQAHVRLAAARRRAFSRRCRLNRALRRLAGSGTALRTAASAARLAGWPVRRLVHYAGDVDAA